MKLFNLPLPDLFNFVSGWAIFALATGSVTVPAFSATSATSASITDPLAAPQEQFCFDVPSALWKGELWTLIDGTWIRQNHQMDQWRYPTSLPESIDGVSGKLLRGTGPDGEDAEAFFPGPGAANSIIRHRHRHRTRETWSAWQDLEVPRPLWPIPKPAAAPAAPHPARLGKPYDGTVTTWTDTTGRTIRGKATAADASAVTVLREGGTAIRIPWQLLIPEDQIILLHWMESRPFSVMPPREAGVTMAEGMGNQKVASSKGEDGGKPNAKHAYETAHFTFLSGMPLNAAHLHEVGVTFEAVRKFSLKMPWGLTFPETHKERFKARLFENKAAYYAAGGNPASAGFFSPVHNEFFLPFESIGLKPSGETVLKSGQIDRTVLQHELMHQMMQDLLPWLPIWISEGCAEFTGQLPMNRGKLPSVLGPKDIIRYLEAFPPDQKYYDLQPVVNWPVWPTDRRAGMMGRSSSSDEIGRPLLYSSSFLLFTYYIQLDQDRSRMIRCFAAARRMAMESKLALGTLIDYHMALESRNNLLNANVAIIAHYNNKVELHNKALDTPSIPYVRPPSDPVWFYPGPGPSPPVLHGDMEQLYAAELASLPLPRPWTPPPPPRPPAAPSPPNPATASGGPTSQGTQTDVIVVPGQSVPGSNIKPTIVRPDFYDSSGDRFGSNDPEFIQLLKSPRSQLIQRRMNAILQHDGNPAPKVEAAFKKMGINLPRPVRK